MREINGYKVLPDELTYTETEIFQQPRVWLKVFELIKSKRNELSQFLLPIIDNKETSLILTGAGSSAFIGESIQLPISKATGRSVKAIPTTDLVTHPEVAGLSPHAPLLLVSFARSGNSPESVETVRLLDASNPKMKHFFITCNPEGELARLALENNDKYYCLLLPEETNDKSLAMTSSFSSMLLAALLAFNVANLENSAEALGDISKITSEILGRKNVWKKIGNLDFNRAVFLGSGSLLGISNECHLKLQELSDGQIVCKHNSFLGFRHGPRAVVNADTLMVYFLSHDSKISKYEKDLTETISMDRGYLSAIHVGNVQYKNKDDYAVPFMKLKNDSIGLSILPYVVIGQLIGLYKSMDLGLNPDSPSMNGAISRVVQGVKIYK